jgi:hypothetical protein
VLLSRWFLVEDDKLWCASPASAKVRRMLARDVRCGFEVSENAAPYRGVRRRGRATVDESRGKEVLRALVSRYLEGEDTPFARWFLARREPEVAIGIEIEKVTAWDCSARMGGTRPFAAGSPEHANAERTDRVDRMSKRNVKEDGNGEIE